MRAIADAACDLDNRQKADEETKGADGANGGGPGEDPLKRLLPLPKNAQVAE